MVRSSEGIALCPRTRYDSWIPLDSSPERCRKLRNRGGSDRHCWTVRVCPGQRFVPQIDCHKQDLRFFRGKSASAAANEQLHLGDGCCASCPIFAVVLSRVVRMLQNVHGEGIDDRNRFDRGE